MKKTILITGVNGFLGSHLALILQKKYNILGLKRPASHMWRFDNERHHIKFIDILDLEQVFEDNNIDYIIHTATNYGRNNNNLSQIIEANILFAIKLLESAKSHQIKAFINCDTLQNPLSSPYCLSKKHLREYLGYFHQMTKIINIQVEHMYGPKDDDKKFICYLIDNIVQNKNIELTKGEQMRDFIYIDDVASAFGLIVDNIDLLDSNTFELGSGTQIKLRDFIEKILMTYNIIMKENPSRTNLLFGKKEYNKYENMNIKANIKALQEMGWIPQTSIDEGIKKTILYHINTKFENRGGVARKYKLHTLLENYLQKVA